MSKEPLPCAASGAIRERGGGAAASQKPVRTSDWSSAEIQNERMSVLAARPKMPILRLPGPSAP